MKVSSDQLWYLNIYIYMFVVVYKVLVQLCIYNADLIDMKQIIISNLTILFIQYYQKDGKRRLTIIIIN